MRSSLLVRESRREAVPSLTLRASGLRGVGPLVLSPRADLRRGILPRPRAHEVQGGEGQQPRNEARVSFDGVLWELCICYSFGRKHVVLHVVCTIGWARAGPSNAIYNISEGRLRGGFFSSPQLLL